MKEGKPSRTATIVAAHRAKESLKLPTQRVCYDPLAKEFIGRTFNLVINNRVLSRLFDWVVDQTTPGAYGEVVSRTRYIDDYLESCITKDQVEQWVILGAGFDSRAYRLRPDLRCQVFEVDSPFTQRIKKARVKNLFGRLPTHVKYVPVDFLTETLDEKLAEYGYRNDVATVFILEGVTAYLTKESVEKTLSFIRHSSGQGSSVIFNYVYHSVIDRTCTIKGAARWKKTLDLGGERITFGIPEGQAETFLSDRGFHHIKDVTMTQLARTYFGENQRITTSSWMAIVHGSVGT